MAENYGVFNVNDDEMYVMSKMEVMDYLSKHDDMFMTYDVETDLETVVIAEPSAGPNGSFGKQDIDEFFRSYEEGDEPLIIRPITYQD